MSDPVMVIIHPVTGKKARIYKSALETKDKFYIITDRIKLFDVPFVIGILSAQAKAFEMLEEK